MDIIGIVRITAGTALLILLIFTFFCGKIAHSGSNYPLINCDRCGRPYNYNYNIDRDQYREFGNFCICPVCNKEYEKALKEQMQKQERKKVECGRCESSGKFKGYRCEHCKGSGFIMPNKEDIRRKAKDFLYDSSDWRKYIYQ